jgi:hypothetical protein
MMNTEDLVDRLKALKPSLIERYKVMEIGVFGSFIRGEQTTESDIDLLVEFTEDADLFDLVGLSLFLEEALHHKVDIVPRRALRAELREAVLQEVVSL